MPWQTPSLRAVRQMVRDDITAALSGAVLLGNSVLRVMSDANAALAHLTLRYLDWLARQLMPDTAETEWLDRHANIWLGGRKAATFATAVVHVTGIQGTLIPDGSELQTGTTVGNIAFQTTQDIYLASEPTPIDVLALTAGHLNLEVTTPFGFIATVNGVTDVTLASFIDGIDEEDDDDLRVRVLERIREPPMGGDAEDYVAWTLQVPGVTRAWSSTEMGIGCVTVRFMCDDKYPDDLVLDGAGHVISGGGFPQAGDIEAVRAHLNTKRPVAVKDFFVQAPIAEPISFLVTNLSQENPAVEAEIKVNLKTMLREKAAPAHMIDGVAYPAQTIYAAWVYEAIMATANVDYFDLTIQDHSMPYNGSMGVLGAVSFS